MCRMNLRASKHRDPAAIVFSRTRDKMTRKIGFVFPLILFCLCLRVESAHAATIDAASCNSNDIQTALNLVTSDGSTVTVPAGTCTWTSHVVMPGYSITLQGAGSGGTHIIVNIPAGFSNDAIFVGNECCNGKQFRITGFDWQYESADAGGILTFTQSTGYSVRIDHNTAEPYPSNPGYGRFLSFAVPCVSPGCVVDHNTITDLGVIVESIQPGDSGNGSSAWIQAMPFENVNAVYFENNTMNYPSFAIHEVDIDCDDGGAYVFRYNSVYQNAIANHGYDTVDNGCRMQNVYMNAVNPNGVSAWGVQYRGGTGVVWSNTYTSHGTAQDFGITNYRSNSNAPSAHGYCNGTNSKDGNVNPPVSYGWGCYEQIGRGSGASAGLTSQPLYSWDNCMNSLGCTGTSSQISPLVYNAGSGTNWTPYEIVQNRDFYDSVGNFNGTTGVGIGTLATRPSSCSAGVAYWATDQNTLYQCNSSKKWTTFYQPFTYPHPLQNSLPSPVPPSGLLATVQ